MMQLTVDEQKRYSRMARDHAAFLCDKIFKPAFEMAFIHGAEHLKDEMMSGGGAAKLPTNPDWNEPDISEQLARVHDENLPDTIAAQCSAKAQEPEIIKNPVTYKAMQENLDPGTLR